MFTATQMGSKLRADHPIRGVKIARRFTANLRITGLHPSSEFGADLVQDALISERLPGPSSCWYRRSEIATKLERSAANLMARELRRVLEQDRRAEAKRLQREARDIIAPRVKAHNAFMANLTKHSKALAALAH